MSPKENSVSNVVKKLNKIRQKYWKLMNSETNLEKKTEDRHIIRQIDDYLVIPSDIGFTDKVFEDAYISHVNELIQILNKRLKKVD